MKAIFKLNLSKTYSNILYGLKAKIISGSIFVPSVKD